MASQRTLILLSLGILVVISGSAGASDFLSPMSDATDAVSTSGPQTSSPTTAGAAATTHTADGTLEVHFINVGQSESTLVITPKNETILIDSGDWRNDGKYVLSYLQQRGITRIDHLVTSHADADHIGGHAAVIEYFETQADGIGAIYDSGIASNSQTYQNYLDAVSEYNIPLYQVAAGDRLPVDELEVSVLGPPEKQLANGERNENSIVLMMTYGEHRFLFTGDAETEAERYLVETYGQRLNATVLKAGHHGSKSSTRESLLDTSTPQLVVISSAYDSQYGHPHEETLQRLAQRSISTYWTAVHGTVVLTSDGKTLCIGTQQDATTNPTELRSADPLPPGTGGPVVVRERVSGGTSPGSTPVVTDGGSPTTTTGPSTDSSLVLTEIHEDASGNDGENLVDEYLVFENTDDQPLNLSGWTVTDEIGHTYAFPSGFTLDSGARVTLYTGSGTDAESELYWKSSRPVWNNGGDTVIVTDDSGTVVVEKRYA